jgi:hypothetical protein
MTKWHALALWWLFWIAAGIALDRWLARHYGNIDWAHQEDDQ